MKQFFIIGYYVNQDFEHYCTVVVCGTIDDAKTVSENLITTNESYRKYEVIKSVSEKEIDEVRFQGDLWNQIEIIDANTNAELVWEEFYK
jgi:hypothetical protein